MARPRIDVRTLTRARFNPPVGCNTGEVIASWIHAQQLVGRDCKREEVTEKQARAANQARGYCREALASDRTDWDVIQFIKSVIKHYGL